MASKSKSLAVSEGSKKTTTLAKSEPKGTLANLKAAEEDARAGFMRMAALLSGDVKPEALAFAYHVIDKEWKKIIEAQREACREALLELAKENDNVLELDYGGETFRVKRGTQKTLDETKIKAKLLEAGIPYEQVFKQQVSYVLDLNELAEALSTEEIEECKRIKSTPLTIEKL